MKTIWYLVKFCEKEEWADDFLKGSLYLNRLSYFKKKEAEDDDRFDKHEAIASWLQPSGTTIKFLSHPELDIHPEDLGAPVLYRLITIIICMYFACMQFTLAGLNVLMG